MSRCPGALADLGVDTERHVSVRLGVVVVEVIDHLLDAHRTRGRHTTFVQLAANHRVARRIHVDREGGAGIVFHRNEGVVRDLVIRLGVVWLVFALNGVAKSIDHAVLRARTGASSAFPIVR